MISISEDGENAAAAIFPDAASIIVALTEDEPISNPNKYFNGSFYGRAIYKTISEITFIP
jgi:hypothetical protein